MNQLSGKLYPDKTFTIGIVPKKKVKSQDKQYERSLERQYDSYLEVKKSYKGIEIDEVKFFSGYKHIDKTKSTEEKVYESTVVENPNGSLYDFVNATDVSVPCLDQIINENPLFIRSPKSSPKKRGSYGKYGITGFGKKVVKNGALLLERKYGKSRLGFVTCTLPSFTEEIQRTVNANWGDIVRRFYQKLTRQLQKIGKPCVYVGVTEIQEKRFAKYGLPCPHLHFVYLCRDSTNLRYWLYICQIHRAWNAAIGEVLKLRGHSQDEYFANGFGSVHAACIRKSASAYLGKYMSKGCKVIASMQEKGWCEFPRQWWTASMQVKKMFKDSIIRLKQSECAALFYGLEEYLYEGVVTWGRFIEVNIDNDYFKVGCVGVLSSQAYRIFTS